MRFLRITNYGDNMVCYTKKVTGFINPSEEFQRTKGKEYVLWVSAEIADAFQFEFYSHLASYIRKDVSLGCFKM